MTFVQLRNQYLVRLLILNIILVGIYILISSFSSSITSHMFPYIILLFTLFSYFAHTAMLKATQISFRKFTQAFLISTTVKLLLYLSLMAAYAFTHREFAKIFILNFAAIYFVYTPFEVFMILNQAKKIK